MSILAKINEPKNIKSLNDEELTNLSQEIRDFIIESVSKTGGHLASNLGVVELTIVIHRIFDSPVDKIVWDVGHQAYVHKILTGRCTKFSTLRKFGGLSGFPKGSESEHDVFNTGHSSTSISAALGMAKGRDIKGEKFKVVAVIGDGALTGGMAFEALNDAGHSKNDLIVILNDNEMSIAQNVGGLSKYLSTIRTQPLYNRLNNNVESMINKIPKIGGVITKTLQRAKGSIKHFIIPGQIFEDLGFTYLGPVDGHNITELNRILNCAKALSGPVLVHVLTKKGKGYEIAERSPSKFHGIGSFDILSGAIDKIDNNNFSNSFGSSMCRIAESNKNIVAITAAMAEGTGLLEFSQRFPERFFDVGIAEQHAITFAGGLAKEGLKPVVAIYSTFLQRAYDQILHDIAIQKLPVVFAVDRAGIVGNDGETHHGVFDLSFLSHIPNMTITAPRNYAEQDSMLNLAIAQNGPFAIRYPRGCEENIGNKDCVLEFGRAEIMAEGEDIMLLGVGKMSNLAYKVAKMLEERGISACAANARFIKPFDEELVRKWSNNNRKIVIIEDNILHSGFGSSVLQFLNHNSLPTQNVKLFGFPNEFITHGSLDELYNLYGLTEKAIFEEVYKLFDKKHMVAL